MMLLLRSKSRGKVLEQIDDQKQKSRRQSTRTQPDGASECPPGGKIRHFWRKVGRKWGPPCLQRSGRSSEPHSSRRKFASRWQTAFAAPQLQPSSFSSFTIARGGPEGAGLWPAGEIRPKAFGLRPKAGRRPDPKRAPFWRTISLRVTCDHEFRDCHSDEETIPFFATRGSVQRSATAQSAEATVGRKKSERSPERQPRVQKSRKKSSFFVAK